MAQIGRFSTPAVVIHGAGALAQLPEVVRSLGGAKVGLVTDAGVVRAGLRDKVLAALGESAPCYEGVQPEPSYELVHECRDFLRGHGCDLVVAVGGGSAMDVAKMSAALVRNEGPMTDYFGLNKMTRPGLPVIAIPTTAGTGSEVSPAAVFVDPYAKRKVGARSDFILARAAILDPELTLSLPQPVTASTGIDALTHAIETYTARAATPISDMAAERATEMICQYLPAAYARGYDIEARAGQLMGSYIAGLALAIANVGAVHALAQALGGMFPVAHGVANALFLPYVMEFNRIGCREKYARLAKLMGQSTEGLSLDEASFLAVDTVRELTQALNIPQRLSELDTDVPEEALDDIAQSCIDTQQRVITNNPRTMNLQEARALLEEAY
ncbi:MAG: iron-containing alcohol dehydrogenase [Chloroflexota bacterium]